MDKVILIHPNGKEQEFDAAHAARLMALPNNGGWKYKKQPKKGKNANRSGTTTAEVKGTQAADEDCGCH